MAFYLAFKTAIILIYLSPILNVPWSATNNGVHADLIVAWIKADICRYSQSRWSQDMPGLLAKSR